MQLSRIRCGYHHALVSWTPPYTLSLRIGFKNNPNSRHCREAGLTRQCDYCVPQTLSVPGELLQGPLSNCHNYKRGGLSRASGGIPDAKWYIEMGDKSQLDEYSCITTYNGNVQFNIDSDLWHIIVFFIITKYI